MVLTAVLAAGAVVPVLLVMTKKAGAPVSAVLGITTAVAAVAVAASRADAGALPAWWLPVAWLVSVLGVPLALADARHRRLPDVLTLPAYPAIALTLTLAALSGGGWRLAAGALLGCLLFGGTHLIVHRLSAGGLGPGDVKLAGSFGAVLGAVGGMAPAVAAVLAALVSVAAFVPMWLTRRIRQLRGSARLPAFAPPLSATPTPPPVIDPTVVPSLRSEVEGGLHEPTPSQPDSPPLAADPAQPSTPTATPSTLTDSATATPSAPTNAAPVPRAPVAAPSGSASTSTEPALVPRPASSSPPTGLASAPPAPATAPTAPAPTSTGVALPPRPAQSAPPPDPALSRIRAGPLRVPYGPGLVLATWACAVFPAAGTGIA
ncbi:MULTISPECIES: prepilin peptidase [unclassified Amycolatopsis]|uniref:prepilin peptidase n=1 Tax=unclassified Amycolatopsis TaxID=2618356 RepID=UPI00106EC6B1